MSLDRTKPKILALAGFARVFLSVSLFASAVSATELSSCQEISASGYYNLTQSVNSSGICFTITANDNIVIKSLNIVQGNLSLAITYEIYVGRMV